MNRLALLVPVALIPATAHADLIFGLNSPASGAGIYLIDTATGASSLYRATPAAIPAGANGLAYDLSTDTFYYAANSSGNDHIIRCAPSGETDLGPVPSGSQVLSATFYNGSYWYHPNAETRVYRATFPTPSTTSISFQNIPAFPANASFGDIASLPDGTTYASYSSSMRRYNLNSAGAGAVPLSGASLTMQLAFHGTTLWGISGSDQIYTVNTTSGVSTPVSTLLNTTLTIVDAATIPAPASAFALAAFPLLRRRRR